MEQRRNASIQINNLMDDNIFCLSLLLCRRVVINLPREIRDIIYSYIVPPNTHVEVSVDDMDVVAYPHHADVTTVSLEKTNYELFFDTSARLFANDKAQLWKLEHVGLTFRLVLAEIFYHNGIFHILGTHILSRSLTADRWGIGLDPARLI